MLWKFHHSSPVLKANAIFAVILQLGAPALIRLIAIISVHNFSGNTIPCSKKTLSVALGFPKMTHNRVFSWYTVALRPVIGLYTAEYYRARPTCLFRFVIATLIWSFICCRTKVSELYRIQEVSIGRCYCLLSTSEMIYRVINQEGNPFF